MQRQNYFKSILSKLTLLIITIAVFSTVTSCEDPTENENTNDLYKNSPYSSIHTELKGGFWFWGSLGPISYYDRDGHEVGNATEAARQYFFSEEAGQGRFEFMQYLGMRNGSNCVTEIYTTKKGTVFFEGTDKVIFYPVEGNFKTVKSGCSDAGTSTRKATADDLKAETYLWEVKTSSGEPLLYIYNTTDTNKEDPIFVYSYAQ
jgi:hypothetical protein